MKKLILIATLTVSAPLARVSAQSATEWPINPNIPGGAGIRGQEVKGKGDPPQNWP